MNVAVVLGTFINLTCITFALAHDEGHGPKVSDQPRQGGIVMPVVDKSEMNLGPAAKLIYKSELVRRENGDLLLYLYDEKMNRLPVESFGKTAYGKIGPMKKNPKWKLEDITFEIKDGAFVGRLPKIKVKPYFIDITLTEEKKSLLTAFDNLD